MDKRLLIGMLHLDIQHGYPRENRATLLAHAEEAAVQGAQIIIAPELALSGYSFDSMDEIAPYTELLTGETVTALSVLARRYGVFIGTGIAEADESTGIFYNSSVMLGPQGNIVALHRKHVAERRWSCPGQPSKTSFFDTPWGRVGLLICADSYYGLLPRAQALWGVDLVLISANWPPSGLDPRELWRARALENGVGVIAVNRTGRDRQMDCRNAPSYAVTPDGKVLLDETSETSCVFYVEYPLERHHFPTAARHKVTAARRPQNYNAIALDAPVADYFTAVWGLPDSGIINIECFIPAAGDSFRESILTKLRTMQGEKGLLVLPRIGQVLTLEEIALYVNMADVAVATEISSSAGIPLPILINEGRITCMDASADYIMTDFASARIALVRSSALLHPETAVALSKQGCDIIVSSVDNLDNDLRLLLGIKCLERAVVVIAGCDRATICIPPEGHERWQETILQESGSYYRLPVDTNLTRKKHFLDRVDLKVLLKR